MVCPHDGQSVRPCRTIRLSVRDGWFVFTDGLSTCMRQMVKRWTGRLSVQRGWTIRPFELGRPCCKSTYNTIIRYQITKLVGFPLKSVYRLNGCRGYLSKSRMGTNLTW
ncbi:uncharacterized protein G2W53_010757 [Senna tora]|uniref:Uncharacterized protein n=1 Tax=Senna tora TaxID=362788 RepID=A0A834X089_9FABA|nr:uncharacterized protein G2W53_010757 [Senna tora]